MLTRRNFAAAILATSALTACGTTPAALEAQTITDLGLLANGLTAFGPLLSSLTGVPTAILTTVSTDIGLALGFVKAAQAATTQAAAQGPVAEVETYFGLALSDLQNVTLPTEAQTIVTALSVLLPVVEAAVGIATNAVGASSPAAVAVARATLAGV